MPQFAGVDFLRRNSAGEWQPTELVTEVLTMGPASILGVTSIAMLVGFSPAVAAQDWGRILEERANPYAGETIDKGLDAAEDAVRRAPGAASGAPLLPCPSCSPSHDF